MNWLQKQNQQNQQALFIQEGSHAYSLMDVSEMVQTYSQSFLRQGIQPNDRIFIYLPGGTQMAEIILACFEIGATATPISPMLSERERRAVIDKIQPKLIITNWKYKASFTSYSLPLTPIEELPDLACGCSSAKNSYKQNSDDIAVIILTSGTTGIPKAVQLTYDNFEVSCSNWNNFLQFEPNDQFLCCLPLHHIGGLAVLIRALMYGFSVNFVNEFQAETVLKTINNNPVTIISLVPTMLKRILDLKGGLKALQSLRWILLGGGPSPEYLLDICQKSQKYMQFLPHSNSCSYEHLPKFHISHGWE